MCSDPSIKGMRMVLIWYKNYVYESMSPLSRLEYDQAEKRSGETFLLKWANLDSTFELFIGSRILYCKMFESVQYDIITFEKLICIQTVIIVNVYDLFHNFKFDMV